MSDSNNAACKNVLLVSPSLSGGGAERVILWLAEQFNAAGACVVLVTISGADLDAYPVPEGITRIALNLAGESTTSLGSLRKTYQRVRAVAGVMKSCQPDIAVSFQTTANVYAVAASMLNGGRNRVPVIIAERNYTPLIPLSRIWRLFRKFTYARAHEVVSQSQINANWLEQHKFGRRQCVIFNPVVYPLVVAAPIQRVSDFVKTSSPFILAVGRLVHAKGFDRLLRVFSKLAAEYPAWRLVILGHGDSAPLRQLAGDVGISEQLILPGRAGNVGQWYDAAQVFVLSSRREGFPNVLVEAMSYGCAAVAMNCLTGPADIIDHGDNGELVRPETEDALEQSLRRVMADASYRRALGNRATDVRQIFNPDAIFSQWQDVVNRNLRSI